MISQNSLGFGEDELKILKKLNTPKKVQDFLDSLPINFDDETYMSPRRVLREHKAHCVEGAIFAAAVLWLHGQKPLLLDLEASKSDLDHVVALFRSDGHWGAISKTNHAVLRYREPVYKNVRELAMSYFHEYFLDDGRKTLRSFSIPFNLANLGKNWVTAEEELWYIGEALDQLPHHQILTRSKITSLRPADPLEIRAGKLKDW